MNPGLERFLILGCVAVLILELPQLLLDLELGDGFPGESPSVALVVEPATPTPAPGPTALMASLEVDETVLLPAVPGL